MEHPIPSKGIAAAAPMVRKTTTLPSTSSTPSALDLSGGTLAILKARLAQQKRELEVTQMRTATHHVPVLPSSSKPPSSQGKHREEDPTDHLLSGSIWLL